MIGIRADANEVIASGHIMRCMAIAQQIKMNGEEVIFITADDKAKSMIEERGFCVKVLHTQYDHMLEEVESLKSVIAEKNITLLLIDSYFISSAYFEKIGECVNTAYIDDYHTEKYPVDMVISYALGYDEKYYEKLYQGQKTVLLAGTKYAPLREEFSCQTAMREENHVLVTTGGSDPLDAGLHIVQEIVSRSEFDGIMVDIVSGNLNPNRERLYEIAKANKNIRIHEQVKKMSELMKSARLAISAGGTTLLELCAMGVPTICYAAADNQSDGVKRLGEEKIMYSLGNLQGDIDKKIGECVDILYKLYQDQKERENYRKKMQCVTDGKGAGRIAKEICRYNKI